MFNLQLVGIYADGSNVSHLDDPLLVRTLDDRDLSADALSAIGEMFAAQEACKNNYGGFSAYLVCITRKVGT